MKRIVYLLVGVLTALAGGAAEFSDGDRVQLAATHALGVPVRNQPGDNSYFRWPDGAKGIVLSTQDNYVQVEAAGAKGWILGKYLLKLDSIGDEGTELPSIVVGAWNLEHMHDGATRGFPELMGTRALPERTLNDYDLIARAIRDRLGTAVLMLSEIAGIPNQRTSVELDRLTGLLGPSWKYTIGSSGGLNGAQRVAIIYDESRVEALLLEEIDVPEERIDGSDIFDRDPLVGFFRVKRSGSVPATDFLAVALHLASGQHKVANHNKAMQKLRESLRAFCQARQELRDEVDVILGGDINASRYDNKLEDFWVGFDPGGFKFATLSPENGDDYLATRLKGDPLFPGSQIDYLFASERLLGALSFPLATVHHGLAPSGDFLMYRRNYSDHFPVTVTIIVANDTD